jgi:hypothetical protein
MEDIENAAPERVENERLTWGASSVTPSETFKDFVIKQMEAAEPDANKSERTRTERQVELNGKMVTMVTETWPYKVIHLDKAARITS